MQEDEHLDEQIDLDVRLVDSDSGGGFVLQTSMNYKRQSTWNYLI